MGNHDIAVSPPPKRPVYSYKQIVGGIGSDFVREKATGLFAVTLNGSYYQWGDWDFMYITRMNAHLKAKELQAEADRLFALATRNYERLKQAEGARRLAAFKSRMRSR